MAQTKGKKGGASPKGSSQKKNNQTSDARRDSVRGGAQQRSSRGQEAARRASGWEAPQKSTPPTEKKSSKPASGSKPSPAKAQSKAAPAKSRSKAASKPAGGQKTSRSTADPLPLRRMMVIGLGVLAVVCFAIQLVSCASSRVDTRQTVMVTLADNIETTGVAIRNEQVITSDRSGVIVGAIDNGGKVSKGETVANVFTSTDAARAYARMEEIENDLEKFQSMQTAGEESAAAVTALQKSVGTGLKDMSTLIYRGDIAGAADSADNLLYLLNKTQVATRVEEGFEDKVEALTKELESLKKKYSDAPEQLKSPLSGYYISTPDGYESLLNTDICASLTPEKLDEIISVHSAPDNSSVVGKIADDYIWYMACEVSAEDADRLAKKADGTFEQKEYTLFLAYSELDSITARLVGVNTGADSGRRVLIFECSYMVSELATVRIQPVTIQLSSYSGLEVSKDSVFSQEVTVSSSDIAKWDTVGREALAREIYPQMFADEAEKEETSGSDVSGSDVSPEPIDKESAEYKAAFGLLREKEKTVGELTKDVILPPTVTYVKEYVYITWGNEIKKMRIIPVYRTGDKVLCAYNLGGGCLKMYDMVVDDPEEVYDGQIINNMR